MIVLNLGQQLRPETGSPEYYGSSDLNTHFKKPRLNTEPEIEPSLGDPWG